MPRSKHFVEYNKAHDFHFPLATINCSIVAEIYVRKRQWRDISVKELPRAMHGHQGRQMCSLSRKYCTMTNTVTKGTGHRD